MPDSTGARDFDFLIGKWNVRNRMLNVPQSNSWSEFEATLEVGTILKGFGNVDQYKVEAAEMNFEGSTLRVFNPQTQQWSLYWVDTRTHVLQPPVVGSFKNGRGEFFAKDIFNGKNILVKFSWSDITSKSAYWDQAFSEDDGATWVTNWIMEFTRI